MSLLELFKDAFKYPTQNFKIVIILGIIATLSELSGYVLILTTNIKVIFPLGVLGLIIGMLGLGYLFSVTRTSLERNHFIPGFVNWKNMLSDGFRGFIVILVYLVPIIILILYFLNFYPAAFTTSFEGLTLLSGFGLILGRFFLLGIPDLLGLSYNITFVSGIGFFGIGYIILILPLIFVSLVHMVKNSSIKKAFNFKEIFRIIQKIGLKFIIWYMLTSFIYLAILGLQFIVNLFISINLIIILSFLVDFIMIPYIYICIARSIALLYAASETSKN